MDWSTLDLKALARVELQEAAKGKRTALGPAALARRREVPPRLPLPVARPDVWQAQSMPRLHIPPRSAARCAAGRRRHGRWRLLGWRR
jgi:hypothetical protein